MTPYEARKPSNEADVKATMEQAATSGIKFPPLRVGDTVRMLLKRNWGTKNVKTLSSLETNGGRNNGKLRTKVLQAVRSEGVY